MSKVLVAESRSIKRSVLYIIQVKITTQNQVNRISIDTKIFLNSIINKILDWIVVLQVFALSSLCSLIVIFEESIKLSATKIFVSISDYAIAQYDSDFIQETIERAIFNNVEY